MSNMMSPYQQFIHLSKYARFRDDLGRRENWQETVDRYVTFFEDHLGANCGYKMTKEDIDTITAGIHDLEAMPSMRCLMTAGEALKRDNIAAFNCSYTPIDRKEAFSEILYILMCGTGVGYSVERQYITRLPTVPADLHEVDDVIVVEDSKRGWAESYRQLIISLYRGRIPKWDMTKVRKAGERLMVFGGRASGPAPLEALFRFTVNKFLETKGGKFNSAQVSDIVCMVGEIVVVGGVRRSALICLSNLSDDRMRHYKSGDWRKNHPYRAMANISFAATERPETGVFMSEWQALYDSKSGERGIFNRYASNNRVTDSGMRVPGYEWGTNPCGEIILRPQEFCNLSEIVVRRDDDHRSMERKVRLATILGTMQSSLTDYKFIGSDWKTNSEEERLLGVSMTGIMSNKLFQSVSREAESTLHTLRMGTREINREWAKKFGIDPSSAITCNKPSGTVSKLVASPSGVHPGYNEYYQQAIRAPLADPMTTFLINSGVPWEPAIGKEDTMVIFYFAVNEPGLNRHDLTAVEHMNIVQMFAENWTDHNPSSTIYVKEREWPEVGAWVWNNFDRVGGMTFLPSDESGHVYEQAPWQDLTKETYDDLVARSPKGLDWEELARIENGEDNVTGTRDLACTGGVCAIPDLV
jgi:ribonucleoside-triphosphate reductase (thioredoxin)